MFPQKNNFIIYGLPVLSDNIVWIWIKEKSAVVVDPSVTAPIATWLRDNDLTLKAVLQTHHHEDHIGGTMGLIKEWPLAEVIASKSDYARIPFQTYSVKGQEKIQLMGENITVLEVPGHTKFHLAFYLKSKNEKIKPAVFCGDTLFGAGCGRLFEGSPKTMFKSLSLINSLPKSTQVYCAHEYTETNLKWAQSLRPQDKAIKARLEKVLKLKQLGQLSLPSSISIERETNLFLQAKSINEFTILRSHKDSWQG